MLQQAVQQPSAPAARFDHSGPAGQAPMPAAASHQWLCRPRMRPRPELRRLPHNQRINRELVAAGKKSSLEVLKVVARNLGQMNGVNLATSFHRISRGGEECLRASLQSSPGVLSSLLERPSTSPSRSWLTGMPRCLATAAPSSPGPVRSCASSGPHFLPSWRPSRPLSSAAVSLMR